MKTVKQTLLINIFMLLCLHAISQVKFGNNPTTINTNSLLELESLNKGLLLPRIALTQTTLPAPLTAHVQGMFVFNTASVNDVAPGIYYNDGTKWSSLNANANFWNITGNTATTAGTNFVGTTDNTDLVFKIKNTVSGWLNYSLSNTAFGFNSLPLTSTGGSNSAIGDSALSSNTSGAQNIAVGSEALQNNTSGYLNTAVGVFAMQYNTFGGLNTAYGTQSMQTNISGNNNTAMGYISLNANQTGNNNTAVGAASLGANTNANNNTAIGYQALQNNVSGSDNTALGYSAATSLNSGNNNIIIGDNAQPSSAAISNEVTVGNSSNNSYRIYAASWTNASDRKLKHDIKELPVGLDFIMGLRPVEFVYNNANNQTKSLGFIAQDVETVMKANNMDKGYDLVNNLDEKNLGLNTTELIAILAKSIQQQQKIIEDQNKRIEKLEKLLKDK